MSSLWMAAISGAIVGVAIGVKIAEGWYNKRLREMQDHIKEVEGYYREYQMASYKNAVRIEIVRDVVRGVAERLASSGSPYRDSSRPNWMHTVNVICDGHGLRVRGPFDNPIYAAVDDDETEVVLPVTVFPLGLDYWSVSEMERE